MERVITGVVDHTVVPMSNVIVVFAEHGVLLAVFVALWIAFAAGLVVSQGSLDSTWEWIGSLPLVIQWIVWLLFLPVVAGLWVWESSWPLVVRLVIVVGLAGWNVMVFLPRAAQA
ncbi:MAG TPA: hypothetical protein VIV06_04005 [Candidatus Limnocylindrales bacterium]